MALDGFLGRGADIGLADGTLGLGPRLAGQGGGQFAVFEIELGIAPPGGAAAQLGGGQTILAEGRKIGPPGGVHRVGVFEVLAVKRLDIGGVGAEQEGRLLQHRIGRAGKSFGISIHFKMLGGIRPLLAPGRGPAVVRRERYRVSHRNARGNFEAIQRPVGLIWG